MLAHLLHYQPVFGSPHNAVAVLDIHGAPTDAPVASPGFVRIIERADARGYVLDRA